MKLHKIWMAAVAMFTVAAFVIGINVQAATTQPVNKTTQKAANTINKTNTEKKPATKTKSNTKKSNTKNTKSAKPAKGTKKTTPKKK